MRTQVRGPGVHIPLHRIEPLAQLPVRQPLAVGASLGEPGVPERGVGPVPATRANPQCGRHSVAGRSVGQATDHDRTVYTMPNMERLAGNPRRKQGRGLRDRRTPADTAHTVVVEDLNTEHQGRDGRRQGHGDGTRPEREAAGRTAPQPSGKRRERPGTETGPQGRGAGHGEPGAYFTNMQPVRPRPQDPPTATNSVLGACGFQADADHGRGEQAAFQCGRDVRRPTGPRAAPVGVRDGQGLGCSPRRGVLWVLVRRNQV